MKTPETTGDLSPTEAMHAQVMADIATTHAKPLPVNHPEYPEGDPRRHWPIFNDEFGFGTDHSDILGHVQEIESVEQAKRPGLQQLLGLIPIDLDGQTYYVKTPKIKALIAFWASVAEYELLSEAEANSPEGLMMAVECVAPLLRRPENGIMVPVTADEVSEFMDPADVQRIFAIAFPQIHAARELHAAGIEDPKPAAGRKKKTGA